MDEDLTNKKVRKTSFILMFLKLWLIISHMFLILLKSWFDYFTFISILLKLWFIQNPKEHEVHLSVHTQQHWLSQHINSCWWVTISSRTLFPPTGRAEPVQQRAISQHMNACGCINIFPRGIARPTELSQEPVLMQGSRSAAYMYLSKYIQILVCKLRQFRTL